MISNQTNLALKGMIGIQAMSVIAKETGHTADATNYSKIAHDYINKWQNLAVNRNVTPAHTTLAYGDASSHGKLQSHETIFSFTRLNSLQVSFTTCSPMLSLV